MAKEYMKTNSNCITDKLVKKFPGLIQFINFGIVGVSNTAIAYSTYAILVYNNIHPQIANLSSFGVSVLNAYIWNRFWVFRKNANKNIFTPLKFFVVYGGNLILGIVMLYLYLDVWHLNKYTAPFLSLILTVPMNYLLNKLWVFKK